MDGDKQVTAVFKPAASPLKALTSYRIVSPAASGTIDESEHTANVTVPHETDVTNLVAIFTTTGSQVKVGTTAQASGITANDFTDPVTYTVVAADGSSQDYEVTVTASSLSAKALTSFGFASPAANGTIDEGDYSVAVTVPHGTPVTALVATFTTTGSQVKVGGVVQVSGTTANDFTDPVIYTVVAADDSSQDYVVTVQVALPSAKALTSFGFVSPAVSGTIDESAHSVAVTLPYGTTANGLVATFTTTGSQVKVGSTVQVSGTTANDFAGPVTYTVVAADASTQDYLVTVTGALSPARALTSFGIVSPAVSGTINESAHTVAVTVPYGTVVTGLVATFTTTGSQVKVGNTVQVSGTTANNFTSTVTYTVVAADGSTQDYVVTVTVALSQAKALTSFGFASPAVSGTINEGAHTVAVTVPFGTVVTALVATFTTTGSQVKVESTVQVSGVTANDFTDPVVYSVMAEDGSSQDYTATVEVAPPPSLIAGIVTHLCGPTGGLGSTDGFGADARFYNPQDVASDGTRLYVVDCSNHTVRSIDPVTAEVTTLAGSPGIPGNTDAIGAAARLRNPEGITFDGTYLYVTDTGNDRIRRVDPATAAVTTLVGVHAPRGITFDGTYLYVVDRSYQVIYRIDPATTVVTILAGSSASSGYADGVGAAARFYNPWGIAFDGTYLYVADTDNHTIRRIDPASAAVTTLAGTPNSSGSTDGAGSAARFYKPTGITFDGTLLYVADKFNHTIRSIDPATAAVATLAGTAGSRGTADGIGASARFDQPSGIVSHGTSIYIADTNNYTIREVVSATATVSSLAGSASPKGTTDGIGAAARFNEPWGVVSDGTNLYVADSLNYRIRETDGATAEVTTLAGSAPGSADGIGAAAGFFTPCGVAYGGGRLYVADTGNHTIREIDPANGQVTTLAGTPGSSGSTDGTGAIARFKDPRGITSDGTYLFVADTGNYTIRRIDPGTAEVTTLAGVAASAGSIDGIGAAARFYLPWGIVSADGYLYVADTWNHTIRKIDPVTSAVTTLAGTAGLSGGADGTGSTARFFNPAGIAFDGTYLYVADSENNTIRMVYPAVGGVTTIAGAAGWKGSSDGTGSAARFNRPYGIAFDGTYLYVADHLNHAIRRIE